MNIKRVVENIMVRIDWVSVEIIKGMVTEYLSEKYLPRKMMGIMVKKRLIWMGGGETN
jgi:hypothetical protein